MKVLVIEDEKLVAESIRAILEHKGFEVETVYDGEAGKEYAELGIYDLLILDVMMPKLDGFQVARQVRADRCNTPILMLTARSDTEDRIQGLNAGADYYLTKPFDSRELLACVNALLRRQGDQVDELRMGNTALDLARTDSGQGNLVLSQVDLSKLVSDAVLPFEPVFFEAGLTLTTDIQPGITLRGSGQHLRQTADILLDNARKYAEAPGDVTVTLTRSGGRCRLAVSNPGPEISKEDLKNIFKRFYRSDAAHTQRGSYGLGLSIAKEIVALHQGSLRILDKKGPGLAVCLELKIEGPGHE